MAASFHPRSCGSLAWWGWLKATVRCLGRWPWEAWVALMAVSVGLGALAARFPGALVLLAGFGVAARPSLAALADRARGAAPMGMWEAWQVARTAWPAWAGPTGCIAALLAGVALQALVAWRSVDGPDGLASAWVVGLWAPFAFRPWGPIGFWGALWRQGCPAFLLNRLQLAAVGTNLASLSMLAVAWFVLLGLLLWAGWLAPLAWLAWVVLTRLAFVDIFEGGLRMERRAPAWSPSRAVPRAQG